MRLLWADKGPKGKEKKGDSTSEWVVELLSCWVVEQLQHPKALIESHFLRAGFFASSFDSSSSEIKSPRNTAVEREQWRRRIGLLDFF